jgi:hypothetical protein
MISQVRSDSASTREIDLSRLPPMAPKILESHLAMWRNPHLLDDLEVGNEGLWVAMHGAKIAATSPSHAEVLRLVEDNGPDDILMIHLPPDDIIEIY